MCIKRIMNKFDKNMKGLVLKILKNIKGEVYKTTDFSSIRFYFKDDELFV